jgi:hypothetical protein
MSAADTSTATREPKPRWPSALLPRAQWVSLTMLSLVMLSAIAVFTISMQQALWYAPWLSPGIYAVVVTVHVGVWIAYCLFDVVSKFCISDRLPKRAYENTCVNYVEMFAFKLGGHLYAALMLLAAWLYVGNTGFSFAVPMICVPTTCKWLTVWLVTNAFVAFAGLDHFVFDAADAMYVYLSEDILQTDYITGNRRDVGESRVMKLE